MVRVCNRRRIQSPTLDASSVSRVKKASTCLIENGRAEGSWRIGGPLEYVVVRWIVVWAAGGEIDQDIACRINGNRTVERADLDTNRSARNVSLRYQNRGIGIAYVDFKPMDQGDARSDGLHLGDTPEKTIGENNVGYPVVAASSRRGVPFC